jgi:predicted alpha/beta hydrolase family esterase
MLLATFGLMMTKLGFEVTLAGHTEAIDGLAEAAFAAGRDNATMASRGDVTFCREATDLESAIGSAFKDLRVAGHLTLDKFGRFLVRVGRQLWPSLRESADERKP